MTALSLPIRLVWLLLSATATMLAQSNGYVFWAPGGVTSCGHTSGAMYLGGGAEGISRIGLGGGGEIGYVTPWESFKAGIGIASVNGSFHFHQSGLVVPFVTGGYTLFFRSGRANGFNVGGGVNWWFADRTGLRIEIRDHVGTGRLRNDHLWAIRLGLTFR